MFEARTRRQVTYQVYRETAFGLMPYCTIVANGRRNACWMCENRAPELGSVFVAIPTKECERRRMDQTPSTGETQLYLELTTD